MQFHDVKNYTINRAWQGETSLIIGCGNGPNCLTEKYKNQHMHNGAYTVDINPQMNPCLVADIVRGGLYGIPHNCMESIELEGLHISYCDRRNIVEEINRVKKSMCYIDVDFMTAGSYKNRYTGEWQNYYGDAVFISFNELKTYESFTGFDIERDGDGYPVLFCNDKYGINKQLKLTDGRSVKFVPNFI